MFQALIFLLKLAYQCLVAPAGPFFTEDQYPDLTNQKWLVSGVTGGIGLEIAKILVRKNAELFIVGRSKPKLADSVAVLRKINPHAIIHLVVIDYNDLSTVKPAVTVLKTQTSYLNGVIHCAGVMNVPTGSKTKQGIEATVGINNCAPQLLQDLIDPLVVNTPNARIVWLSSLAHLYAPYGGFSTKVIANGRPLKVYAVSKALDYIQAVQWTHRHPDATTVKSLSVHPGIIRSNLTRTTSWFQMLFFFNLFSLDTPYGALSPIYAALSPDAVNNDYIIPFGRPGLVKPDVYKAARNERGEAAMAWIEDKIKDYK